MRLISLPEYLMGRDQGYPGEYTTAIEHNARQTVDHINEFLRQTGFNGHVNSGWRPPTLNARTPGAAPHSKHMLALACDLMDHDGVIDDYITAYPGILSVTGLWRENPEHTLGWCHLQTVPYGTWTEGKDRTFQP